MSYGRPAFDSTDASWQGADAYTRPAFDAADAEFEFDLSSPYIFRGVASRSATPWGDTEELNTLPIRLRFNEPPKRDTAPGIAWGLGARLDLNTRTGWQRTPKADTTTGISWGSVSIRVDAPSAGFEYFTKIPKFDQERSLAWGSPVPVATLQFDLGYTNPPEKDRSWWLAWGDPVELNTENPRLEWITGIPKPTVEHRIPWGNADPLRYQAGIPEPLPPIPPPPPPVPPCYQPPFGLNVRGDLVRARYTGDARQVGVDLTCSVRSLPFRRLFMLNHTFTVVRLPAREPIQCTAARLALDEDSWTWSFQLSVADRASFHLLLPTDAPQEIEVAIDGVIWVFVVEDAQETRRAPADAAFTAAGRGRSAFLAAPYHPARSYTNTGALLAAQLADRELTDTGFTLVWQGPEWSVPAGAWSYADLTPMSALLRIAQACGCMVQADRSTDVVRILPRYKAMPWIWPGLTADVLLAAGSVLQLTQRRIPGPKYHGVWVSGETQGVLVNVYRPENPSGPYAQMVVDPLITANGAGRARGAALIADAQDRTEVPLRLPFLPESTGVIVPGEIVQIEDGVYGTFKARSASVSIGVERAAEGAVSVSQDITVYRHHEDLE